MPEIAEVETVRRTLKKKILNKRIKEVNVYYDRIIQTDLNEFKTKLINQSFIDIKRRGKWLIFITEKYGLLSHLRMEGKFYIKKKEDPLNKHEHVEFVFDDNVVLRYHDTRKFGRMILCNRKDILNIKEIKKQGLEPGDKLLNVEYLKEKLNKKVPIKTLLLDQTIISGLGNIYANEVLFAAKINPFKLGCNLSNIELENIIKSSDKIIKEAIKMGGTTIKSYTSSLGVTGRFQQKLMVHKRENDLCLICNSKIKCEKLGGRSTYYCPNCQKK